MCIQMLEWNQKSTVFIMYNILCIAVGYTVIKRGGCNPINRFNPSLLCACPKPGTGFPSTYVMVIFAFYDLR